MTLHRLLGLSRAPVWRQVIGVALVAAVLELFVLDVVGLVEGFRFGRVPVAASAPASIILALLVGGPLGGRPRHRLSAVVLWSMVVVAVTSIAVAYGRQGDDDEVTGLLIAAIDEEVVFRFVIPAVVMGALASAGMAVNRARLGGFAVGAAVFVMLPGHVAQMDSAGAVVAFVAYAAIAAVVVARSGALLAVGVVHAVANITTFLVWSGEPAEAERQLIVAGLFALLLLAYGRPQTDLPSWVPDRRWPMVNMPTEVLAAGYRRDPEPWVPPGLGGVAASGAIRPAEGDGARAAG